METRGTNQPRALVVDDEDNISFLVASALRNEGFDVRCTHDGVLAIAEARNFKPHIVILDRMLPDADGITVLRHLRDSGFTNPILFLSAKSEIEERVNGLRAGGDDYIAKPFALEELIARVQSALRRSKYGEDSKIVVADLVMDVSAHRVWRGDNEAHLSATEFSILHLLLLNPGKVVSRARILDHVWQYDFGGDGAIIETHISNIRKKIDRGAPQLIHTVRGVGYCARPPE